MKAAGRDVHEEGSENETTSYGHCGLPGDGAWQGREYASLNGCVTVFSKGTARCLMLRHSIQIVKSVLIKQAGLLVFA